MARETTARYLTGKFGRRGTPYLLPVALCVRLSGVGTETGVVLYRRCYRRGIGAVAGGAGLLRSCRANYGYGAGAATAVVWAVS